MCINVNRHYLHQENAGEFTAKLVSALFNQIASSKPTWNTVKVVLVRDLQSLMLAALPLTSVESHLTTASNIIHLASREFVSSPQVSHQRYNCYVQYSLIHD